MISVWFYLIAASFGHPLAALDDVVLIIKTGKEVVDTRLMPLLNTSSQFDYFRNRLIVSNDVHAELQVFDAIANMSWLARARQRVLANPELFKEYLARTPPQKPAAKKNPKRAFGRALPGWHTDQHKNLPAFRRAFELFPQAKWFFMIDDDTYVSARNLARFVTARNSSAGVYAGNVMGCNCCEAGKSARYSPVRFAHGGSGILLSNTALARMTDVIDACIFRFSGCWAGDIQVSLCLLGLEPQIKMQGLVGVHSQPPTATLSKTHGRWCENPITFHRMLPEQILHLSAVEEQSWSLRNRFQFDEIIEPFFIDSVIGDRVAVPLSTDVVCLEDTINYGGVLDSKQLSHSANLTDCSRFCEQRQECLGVVFIRTNGTCLLKRNIASVVQNFNATFCMHTAHIKSRFIC